MRMTLSENFIYIYFLIVFGFKIKIKYLESQQYENYSEFFVFLDIKIDIFVGMRTIVNFLSF